MAVWQDNLRRIFGQKEVLILHGNVRDSAYIKPGGNLIHGLTELLREMARAQKFNRIVHWGVFFDHEAKGHSPMWSLERIEPLEQGAAPELRETGAEQREQVVLTRWLTDEITDVTRRTVFVIHYLEKLTAYSQRGSYTKEVGLLVTLVEKMIENIPASNRLVMVTLQDTMVPMEYYTSSPKTAVVEIPLPDKKERFSFFQKHLSKHSYSEDRLDLLANVSDGLFVRDLETILGDVLKAAPAPGKEVPHAELKKIVNRYRIGTEEDPYSQLPLAGPPKGLVDSAEAWFKERIIGQDTAVAEAVKSIRKARAGVVGLASGQSAKPRAVFFFAGPTGVGKTFMAKKLAEYLFDTEEAFIRFDMSEFKEEHTVSKLIGSPPGYVGYERGGMLTNAVKNRPFSIILFDEIEKAHHKIMDIFLQLLDDGRLTDSRGQTVFFTESIVVFTSNIGTRSRDVAGQPIAEKEALDRIVKGEKDPKERSRRVREHFLLSVHSFFRHEISRPELLNRIGSDIVTFEFIDTQGSMEGMIRSKLKDIAANFRDRFSSSDLRLAFAPGVEAWFLERHRATIETFGGRGLVNAIDDEVSHLVASQLLIAEMKGLKGITFTVSVGGQGELTCLRGA